MARPLVPVIVSAAFVACSPDAGSMAAGGASVPVDTPAVAAVDSTRSGPLSCEGLETTIVSASLTREGFRAAYGAPDSMAVTTQPNRHVPGAIDSIFVVHYPGLAATFINPAAGDDLIGALELRDNRYVSDARIGIGAAESAVIALLGPPTRRESDALIYDCGTEVEQPVTFRLRDSRVEHISVSYYVD